MALELKRGCPPVFDLTHSAAVTAETAIIIEGMIVIPQVDAAAGEVFTAIVPGAVVEVEGVAAAALAKTDNGKVAYLITSGNTDVGQIAKASAASNTKVGYLLVPAAVADGGKVRVLLTGPGV